MFVISFAGERSAAKPKDRAGKRAGLCATVAVLVRSINVGPSPMHMSYERSLACAAIPSEGQRPQVSRRRPASIERGRVHLSLADDAS
eukprot:1396533-Prymnesium_polylepis.1